MGLCVSISSGGEAKHLPTKHLDHSEAGGVPSSLQSGSDGVTDAASMLRAGGHTCAGHVAVWRTYVLGGHKPLWLPRARHRHGLAEGVLEFRSMVAVLAERKKNNIFATMDMALRRLALPPSKTRPVRIPVTRRDNEVLRRVVTRTLDLACKSHPLVATRSEPVLTQ